MSAQWGPAIGRVDVPPQAAPGPMRRPIYRRKQFLIAGGVLALVLAYLIYAGVRSAGVYYLSVSELMAQQQTLGDQPVRIQGRVLAGTVEEDPANTTIRFVISDGQTSLPVTYKGVVPDSFGPEADVVMEGRLGSGGFFEAKTLLAKCASKYDPAKG